jgi:PAS domain S-box-containing protein
VETGGSTASAQDGRGPADLERFRRAFDALLEGVLFLERGGVVSYANPAAARIFGPEAAQKGSLAPALRLEVFDEQGARVTEPPGIATLRDGQPRERVPLRLRRSDGTVIWVEVSSAVLAADAQGAPETVVLLCVDTTQERAREQARTRAEAARRQSDRRYRALFDNLASAFALHEVVTDDAGEVIDYVWLEVNPAYERLSGRTAAELIGRRVREVLPGTEAEWKERLGKIARVALHGESLSHEDYVARSARWFENWAFSPAPRQVATLVTETTERHRGEDALRELNATLERRVAERTADLAATNRELEAFSYSVSHDLRAPLRAIDGYTRAIEEDHGAALPEDARRSFARIQAASQRLSALIDDLLQLSRSARAELRRSRVDLTALAHEILDNLRRAEPQREVDVRIEPGLQAEGDPTLARTVLENLLGNAWKYTARRERAHVWFERGALPGSFVVRDDGAGFDMAHADKLFGAFQRLHAASDFPGSGVGLATTRRILTRHGGAIEAFGEPGRGARFTFSFGAADGAAQ